MKPLKEWVEFNAQFASKTFNETGSLSAMWIAETKDGDILPIVAPMTQKDMILAAIKELFRNHHVVRYVFMTEAWVLVAKGNKDRARDYQKYAASGKSLADHPDRREVIVVTGEDKTKTIMGRMMILRPEHGQPTVSPFEIMAESDGEGEISGRMTGLLP